MTIKRRRRRRARAANDLRARSPVVGWGSPITYPAVVVSYGSRPPRPRGSRCIGALSKHNPRSRDGKDHRDAKVTPPPGGGGWRRRHIAKRDSTLRERFSRVATANYERVRTGSTPGAAMHRRGPRKGLTVATSPGLRQAGNNDNQARNGWQRSTNCRPRSRGRFPR